MNTLYRSGARALFALSFLLVGISESGAQPKSGEPKDLIAHYRKQFNESQITLSYSLLVSTKRALERPEFIKFAKEEVKLYEGAGDLRQFFQSESFRNPATSIGALQIDLDQLKICVKKADDYGIRMACQKWGEHSVAALAMVVDLIDRTSVQAAKLLAGAEKPEERMRKIVQIETSPFVKSEVIKNAQLSLAKELVQPGKLEEVRKRSPEDHKTLVAWLKEADRLTAVATKQLSGADSKSAAVLLGGTPYVIEDREEVVKAFTRRTKEVSGDNVNLKALLQAPGKSGDAVKKHPNLEKIQSEILFEAFGKAGMPAMAGKK